MDRKIPSAFAGFLDGYTANNIETNSTILKFHAGEVVSLLEALKINIEEHYEGEHKETASQKIMSAFEALKNKNPSLENYINSSLSFEEFMNNLKKFDTPKSDTLLLVKKIIYHYLNIAKQVHNGQIEELVKNIAFKYK